MKDSGPVCGYGATIVPSFVVFPTVGEMLLLADLMLYGHPDGAKCAHKEW
jgi:hypothetical protein